MKKPLDLGIYQVAPSILAGNHANLAASVVEIKESGAKWVHLDIMDGHFVPNLTFGPQTTADLRKGSDLFFDVHLMLERPDTYFEAFIEAGADLVSVHVEPNYDIRETLKAIRAMNCYCGIVLNPDTSFERVIPYLDSVDLVLQMTVYPGFGGQSFIAKTMDNVAALKRYRDEHELGYRIEVDGGVDEETVGVVKSSGADTFVSGSAFFKNNNKRAFVGTFLQNCPSP